MPSTDLGRLFMKIDHLLLTWASDQSEQPFSLTTFFALDFLQSQGPASMKSLAETLDITPASVTKLSQKLEQAGWIERQPNPYDGRGALLSITPSGCDILSGDYRIMQSFFDHYLDPNGQHSLESLLGQILDKATA